MVKDVFTFITTNSLASTIVGAAILGGIAWAVRAHRNRKDSEAIYRFLLSSKTATDFTFRSTEAIASHTRLSEERVAVLCARHPNIRRNSKEKQSWLLVE
jgi:hypothetical protein